MEKYNGWTNYETWCWTLWIHTDEKRCGHTSEMTKKIYRYSAEDNVLTKKENAVMRLSAELQKEAQNSIPELDGVWADLLGAAFGEINFYEIAESLIKTEDWMKKALAELEEKRAEVKK